jgi:uncharacterized protein (TIGR04255 family)
MNWEYFKTPPIKEAILQILFSNTISRSCLESFKNSELIKQQFSQVGPHYNLNTNISEDNLGKGKIEASKTFIGYNFSTKGKRLSLRTNSISLHIINEYGGWENRRVF